MRIERKKIERLCSTLKLEESGPSSGKGGGDVGLYSIVPKDCTFESLTYYILLVSEAD